MLALQEQPGPCKCPGPKELQVLSFHTSAPVLALYLKGTRKTQLFSFNYVFPLEKMACKEEYFLFNHLPVAPIVLVSMFPVRS